MTQIARSVATMGSMTMGSGKGATMKPGAAGDFAAIVAGLGGDASVMTDAEGFALSGDASDAGTGAGADGEKDKTAEPVILDLALGAAAQSAVADMVVPPPMQLIVQTTDTSSDEDFIASMTGALPSAAGIERSGTEPTRASLLRSEPGLASASTGLPGPAQSSTQATIPTAAAKTPAAMVPMTAEELVSPMDGTATAFASAPMASVTVPARSSTLAAAVLPAKGTSSADPARTSATASNSGSIAPASTAEAGVVPTDADVLAVATPLRPIVNGANAPHAQVHPAVLAETMSSPSAQPPAQAAYAAVQPVMSALHRAGTIPTEVKTGDPASMVLIAGEAARQDPATASDSGSGQDSGGAALSSDGAVSGSAQADALPGGRQFADIIQSLPPIAQSRSGAIGDVAPAVAGAVDVGATLQSEVIDMTVGGQWIDRVAKEITALAEGSGHSRFQLSPPNLGRIQIDVWQGEGGGRVQLLTETDEAAQHLRDGQSNLQADARLAALQLGSITIERAMSSFDTPRDQGSQPQQNASQQQNGRQPQGSDQNGQGGTQTGTQGGSQQNPQPGLQAGLQGGNSGGQGKNSPRRDVLNHQGDTVSQNGGSTGRDGDRLVRYA